MAALEQAGKPREARDSYRALLGRWPDNLVGLIGLGNVEYTLKEMAAVALGGPSLPEARNTLEAILARRREP